MTRNDTPKKSEFHRPVASRDIHDIRALTTTGAITLPRRRPLACGEDSDADA